MKDPKFLISNFRSWHGEHSLDLASMNLLFGGNSSGKSSLIHALALLKQSEPTRRLIPTGDEIDLGRIVDQHNREAASKKKKTETDLISFGLAFDIIQKDIMLLGRFDGPYIPRHRRGEKTGRRAQHIQQIVEHLDSLFYRERYDSLGNLNSISLETRNFQIFEIALTSRAKTTKVKCTVTRDKFFWDLILNDSSKQKKMNLDDLEDPEFDEEAGFFERRLTAIERRITQTKAKIAQAKRFGGNDKESSIEKYSNDLKEMILDKKRYQRSVAQAKIESEAELKLFEANDPFHEALAKEFSFEIDIRNEVLEEANIVSLIANGISRRHDNYNNLTSKALKIFERLKLHNRILTRHSNEVHLNPFGLLRFARNKFVDFTRKIERIGPHRERPDRISIVNPNQKFNKVGVNGENVSTVLKDISPKKTDELNDWFKALEIPYKVKKKFDPKYNIFQLFLLDSDGNEISLSDVGYGIGQVLPIVLMSILRSNTIITIEQPELHLHPKLQANLADLFMQSARENKNIFILETHSEHIVLRLKRRQKEHPGRNEQKFAEASNSEQALEPYDLNFRSSSVFEFLIPEWRNIRESVSLNVIEMTDNPRRSEVTRIRLNKSGDFDRLWPGDFFPERYVEMGLEDL